MSIHSMASNTSNYMQFIEIANNDIHAYQPKTLIRGLYSSRMYEVFEAIAVKESDEESLIDFTRKVMAVVEDYLSGMLPENVYITWDRKHYEPSFRFYWKRPVDKPEPQERWSFDKDFDKEKKEKKKKSKPKNPDEPILLGIFDLPTYTFYKAKAEDIIRRQKVILTNLNKISELKKEREQIIDDYSYENKEGLERGISYVLRKNNAKQAKIEIEEVDQKIQKLKDTNRRLQRSLENAELKDQERIDLTDFICTALQKELNIDVSELEMNDDSSSKEGTR